MDLPLGVHSFSLTRHTVYKRTGIKHNSANYIAIGKTEDINTAVSTPLLIQVLTRTQANLLLKAAITDVARRVCKASSRIYLTVGCPSVCAVDRQQQRRAAGLLLSAGAG